MRALRLLTTPGRVASACKDQEFRDRQRHRIVLPGAGVTFGVHFEKAALEELGLGFLLLGGFFRIGAPQDRLDAFDEQALRERLPDEIVRAHFKAEQFVDLFVFRRQEDHRKI